jgi:hypothetical protein
MDKYHGDLRVPDPDALAWLDDEDNWIYPFWDDNRECWSLHRRDMFEVIPDNQRIHVGSMWDEDRLIIIEPTDETMTQAAEDFKYGFWAELVPA